MPKTASKRTQARKEARVSRAHQTPTPERTISRRVPLASSRAVRPSTRTFRYPWATTIFVLLLVGFIVLVAHQQQLGPWAPPAPPAQATCNLKTHICNKAPINKLVVQPKTYYTATIKTAKGNIVIQLDTVSAPNSAASFIFLAEKHFYDGLTFWKVEQLGKVSQETNQPSNIGLIQGGKGGDAQGGPGYTVKDPATQGTYTAGVVAMANASQFFVNTVDNSQAITTTNYPIIGTVTSGLDVAKNMTLNDKIISITISSTTKAPPTPTGAATATP